VKKSHFPIDEPPGSIVGPSCAVENTNGVEIAVSIALFFSPLNPPMVQNSQDFAKSTRFPWLLKPSLALSFRTNHKSFGFL
jgi:hypothetical protein